MLAVGLAGALAAVAWLYLLVGRGGYWRTDQRLPGGAAVGQPPGSRSARVARSSSAAAGDADVGAPDRAAVGTPPVGTGLRRQRSWPTVTAVVPARNEAGVLPATLPTLLNQEYPGRFDVVVVDDASSDGTAQAAATVGRGTRRALRVIRGTAPPPGWLGKPWAMAQGVAAATGDYILFTDADIAWGPGALRDLVDSAERDDRDLVSQMAMLRVTTGWERLLIPAFVYFFAQLYPFRWVNSPARRTAAAAGGCMLVRRATLRAAGGVAAIRAALIDDVALGRLLKRPPVRARCWLGLATAVRSVRPYPRLADLWSMVARSAYTQLRHHPALLVATLLGLVWCYLVPPVAAITGLVAVAGGGRGAAGDVLAAVAGLVGWAVMTASYLPMQRYYGLSVARAPLLPLAAALYAAMTADSARRHHLGRGGAWKGRTHPGRAGSVAVRGDDRRLRPRTGRLAECLSDHPVA